MARPASPPRTAGRVPRSNCSALGATSSSLFIWHDAVAGRGISHKVVIMYLGGTVEVGPKTELFEQKAPSVRQGGAILMGFVPTLRGSRQ